MGIVLRSLRSLEVAYFFLEPPMQNMLQDINMKRKYHPIIIRACAL